MLKINGQCLDVLSFSAIVGQDMYSWCVPHQRAATIKSRLEKHLDLKDFLEKVIEN